jgi:hypothetical protein
LKVELEIQPYKDQGLSFVTQGSAKSVTFDGKEHPVPGAGEGVTASGRRRGPRAPGYTEKNGGQWLDTRSLSLSADGRTLTISRRVAGQATANKLVFERE